MCGVWINKVSLWIGATWEYVLKFGFLDLLGHVILRSISGWECEVCDENLRITPSIYHKFKFNPKRGQFVS